MESTLGLSRLSVLFWVQFMVLTYKAELRASCILLAEETLPFSTYPSAVEPQACSAYPDSSGLSARGRRRVSLVTDFAPFMTWGFWWTVF